MNMRLITLLAVPAMAFAACGGGGSGSGSNGTSALVAVATPTPVTVAAQGNLPLTEAVGGASGFVNPANHKTLYFLDVDTSSGGTCIAGCITAWPVFAPAAGSQPAGNVAIITRSDGTGQQWTYQGHPLYNFAGDATADQTNGDNFPDFGGHWHVARPAAETPAPGGTAPPCIGAYC